MDIDRIRARAGAPIVQQYDTRDTILFALGLGYGADPLAEEELPFVYEQALVCSPAYANVLCHPGFWARDPQYGIDWVSILHAEQHLVMHRQLPATGRVRGEYRIAGIEDKGKERGALMHQEKELFEESSGAHLATVRSTLFLRGDGGQGGFGAAMPLAERLPDRRPDRVVDIPTLPRQALIYRLSGDPNPLHADPAIARKAGFAAPILHGLCTKGIASRAVLSAYCDNDVARFKEMFVRFSKPVIPGETIRIEFFETGAGELRFRAIAVGRGEVILDRCSATVS